MCENAPRPGRLPASAPIRSTQRLSRVGVRKCSFSLYVTIFLSPLDEGLAGVPLLDRHCRGKASFSTRLDRYRKIVLPLAAFLGQSMIGGTLLRAPII